MSYVLGIDPSITSTGVCLLHNDKAPTFHTLGTTKQKRSVDGGGEMPLALRLWHLSATLMGTLPPNSQPLLAAIETPISPLALTNVGGTGFNNNIMAYAMAYEMLGKFRIPYVEVSTKQRALIATGKGNANKQEVTEAFFTTNQDMFGNPNHNEIDAYWLAMCAGEVYQEQENSVYEPYGGWLELTDRAYDMLEQLEIQRP